MKAKASPTQRLRVAEAMSLLPTAEGCSQGGHQAGLQNQALCFCPGPVPSSARIRQFSECL